MMVDGQIQRGHAVIIGDVDIGAFIYQHLTHIGEAIESCPMKRGRATTTSSVDVGVSFDQQPTHFGVVLLCCQVQRGLA